MVSEIPAREEKYLALDMANGFTFVGRLQKGEKRSEDGFFEMEPDSESLEDAIMVATRGHVMKEGEYLMNPAQKYIEIYRLWDRTFSGQKGVKTIRLENIAANPHVVYRWELGQDILDAEKKKIYNPVWSRTIPPDA